MKISRLIAVIIIPLLFACFPKKPEISLPPVPAGPLIQALDQRRQSFSSLKALASVETVRSGRKRAYDTVGVMLDGQQRLRMEAFGPLGQSLITLVWNGADALLRLGDGRMLQPGPAGLERIFGVAIDAGELCAVLSGNVPAAGPTTETKAFREPEGGFLIEMSTGNAQRRLRVKFQEAVTGQGLWITASELYRSEKLVYRARYEQMDSASQYLIPKKVLIENPERKVSFTLIYNDTDVNVALGEDVFSLTGAEAGVP